MSGSAPAVPCFEVFDENSQPSVEEISDYAQQIGIDPVSESHLLPLAKDGLMQALPSPWKAYYDDKLKTHYFYNTETRVTQWDHPLDQVYKGLVVKARQASERGDSILDDTCISIQDLLTYEEDAKQGNDGKPNTKSGDKSKDGDSSLDSSLEEEINISKSATESSIQKKNNPMYNRTGGVSFNIKKSLPSLNPIVDTNDKNVGSIRNLLRNPGESNTFPRTAQFAMNRFKSFEEENDHHRGNVPRGIQSKNDLLRPAQADNRYSKLIKQTSEVIDLSFNPNKQEEPAKNDIDSHKPMVKKGLVLTGGGSMFLKSNRMNQSFDSAEKISPYSAQNFEIPTSSKTGISSANDNPKGILRDRNFGDILLKPPFLEKNEGTLKFNEIEEDKKSVRFNLEKDVSIQYDYSPSPSSNSSSEFLMDGNQNSIIQMNKLDSPNLDKNNKRRNSESSLNTGLSTNIKLGKLKPFNHDETTRVSEELTKSENINKKIDESNVVNNSPTRKLIKPNPGDFIKPNLFQKPFEKLSDILKTNSPDSDSESEKLPINGSPPPLTKRKLSINLMESVDSEASIDSPDKESINLNALTISNDSPSVEIKSNMALSKTNKNVFSNKIVEENTSLDTLVYKSDMNSIRSAEINKLRAKMEAEMKQIRLNMESSFEKELNLMKERLANEHSRNKLDINKAILAAKQNHDDDIKEALSKLNIEFNLKKEVIIQEEKEKLSENLSKAINHIKEEHLKAIEVLKNEKKMELRDLSNNLDKENMKSINELRMQYSDNLEAEKIRLIADNKSALDKMKIEHEIMCDELRKDYRSEVELVRGQQAAHLSALRDKMRRERESPRPPTTLSPPSLVSPRDDTSYERLRCDKRLLEDKYKCLKEKYARLKSDVKISIERRNRRREQSHTTGSETERSHSHRTIPSAEKSAEAGDSVHKDLLAKGGKRTGQSNNSTPMYRTKNNNELSPPSKGYNNNNSKNDNTIHGDHNASHSDSTLQPNHSGIHNNLLNVQHKHGISISPDCSFSKSTHARDKSPMKRINQKSFNCDNDNSIGLNDISLSQSDSHPVLNNKYNKRVNIVTNPKERERHRDINDRPKVPLKKILKEDPGYADTTVTDYHDSSDTGTSEQRNLKESVIGRSRKKIFTRLKSASTSRLNYSISSKLNERACSPVENLRQQLRKLEDLEEQFPDVTINADTTAYRLRYPFPDSGGGGVSGGELGFLRHRALVEREGIRRARAVLRRRSDLLRQKRRSSAAWQEECELTDMEVSLHRTKSILGEKVIRLRHIEKSLRRIQNDNEPKDTDTDVPKPREAENKDTTLSDISSHSSGFSSTEGHSDTNRNAKHHIHSATEYEHSSEIINSLQTLNTEIRDIWQVLNSQQQMNVAKVIPIGQLLYTDVGWQLPIAASNIPSIQTLPNSLSLNVPTINVPADTLDPTKDKFQNYRIVGNINSKPPQNTTQVGGVATSLVERTRDLRDWLKQQAAL